MTLSVEGTHGEAVVQNFVEPHKDDRVVVRTGSDTTTERHGTRLVLHLPTRSAHHGAARRHADAPPGRMTP
jgi:hypothetical protein